MMLLILLSISDTVSLVIEYLSSNMTMHRGWLFVNFYILAGMLWQLAIARLTWKQKIKQHEIQVPHHEHHSQQGFYQEQHAQNLFE